MKIKFLKVAQQEVEDAFDWYNCQVSDLGDEFLDELDRAVRRRSNAGAGISGAAFYRLFIGSPLVSNCNSNAWAS